MFALNGGWTKQFQQSAGKLLFDGIVGQKGVLLPDFLHHAATVK
jgi:hypothetical protein